ncbi:MAG: metal-dependent hydrolase [archaeon]
MKIRYFGHACFAFNDKEVNVLIDPFISGNPLLSPGSFDIIPDLILVSHDHPDHIGDTISLARRTNCSVLCVYDLGAELARSGLSVIGGNIGGTMDYKHIKITYVKAEHTSKTGVPVGYVIKFSDHVIYFAGDTAIMADMKLIKELYHPDIVILPIDGYYNMGPYEASHAVRLLEPKIVIPMHYGTFPLLKGTPDELIQEIKKQNLDVKVIVFNINEQKEI